MSSPRLVFAPSISNESKSTLRMESTTPSQEASDRYRQWIERLCPGDEDCDIPLWPGYRSLREFISAEHDCTKPPGMSIVNVPGQGCPASEFSIISPESPWDVLEKLPSLADTSSSSQLIIIENICPDSLAILGGTYDIDPQFFAEHVNVLSWYKMTENVPERLTSLPSTKREEDFLVLRYVETREIVLSDDASVYAESVLWPDSIETRIEHSAGKLEPVAISGKTFSRMAFTRKTVSIWCQKKISGNGWIAIMLLDPPFRLAKKHGSVGKAEYRNPNLRPRVEGKLDRDESRQSFREAFCHLLRQRCASDEIYLRTCATDMFVMFYEGYRIIASEWLVVNEYVKRELANIERHLEKSESTFQELEKHLKELYRIRRRCNKDHELVTEAATQCKKRGQALWPASKARPRRRADTDADTDTGADTDTDTDPTAVARRHAAQLEEDMQYVLDNMSISISRIEKNITLLMALVTISEGRQGLQENKGIAFLTLVATIFLPFGTVAAILGIQTQYGPGASGFWMLWAVAVPLTVLVVTISFLYPAASAGLNHMWASYLRSGSKTGLKPSCGGALGEGAGRPNDSMPQMGQTSPYGEV